MTKTLTFDFNAVEIRESAGVDKKGKPVTWVNFNIEPFVKLVIVEVAKANGYHVPKDGLGWSCRARDFRGMGAGFVKVKAEEAPSAKAEKPSTQGAVDTGLGDRLATIEKALAMLLTQNTTASHAPIAKQPVKKVKAAR